MRRSSSRDLDRSRLDDSAGFRPGSAETRYAFPVSVDAEGYGFPEHQKTLARLIDDIRVLSPAGVERAAQGWDRHARLPGLAWIHAAEKAAVHAIGKPDHGPARDEGRGN